MRNSILIFIICLNTLAFSQTDSVKENRIVIKTDLVLPIISYSQKGSGGVLSFETNFLKRSSLSLSFLGQNISSLFLLKNYQVIPEYRLYFSHKQRFQGFYSGVYLKYLYNYYQKEEISKIEPTILKYEKRSLSCGMILGFQYLFRKRISIDIIGGIGYRKRINFNLIESVNTNYKMNNPNEIDGRFAVQIGYAF